MYHKGELSTEAAANLVGFKLPESGVYPDDGLLGKGEGNIYFGIKQKPGKVEDEPEQK